MRWEEDGNFHFYTVCIWPEKHHVETPAVLHFNILKADQRAGFPSTALPPWILVFCNSANDEMPVPVKSVTQEESAYKSHSES